MPDQEIHIIGYDEYVMLFGLIGIDGTILEKPENFLKEFKKLITNPSIRMIIIAVNLPSDVIDYLIDFKLNTIRPFIYYLPDIFEINVEKNNIFSKKIRESISKIIH